MAEVGLFEAMHTQRAIRRYKPDPVPDDLIRKVIDAAVRAPSASNSQPWRFVVVRDPALRAQLCDYYKKAWQAVDNEPEARARRAQSDQRVIQPATRFVDLIRDVPVLILVCATERGAYSSVYPAAQNLMLAARGLGLGTIVTTLHTRYEREIKELLGIPEGVQAVAMIPLGYPAGGFGPTRRMPGEEVTFHDRWDTRQA